MTAGSRGPGDSENPGESREHFKVTGEQLAEKVRELLHEGNVRHLILRHDGHIVLEIPVGIGVASIVLAPILAAVAAVGALVAHCTIEVVRTGP